MHVEDKDKEIIYIEFITKVIKKNIGEKAIAAIVSNVLQPFFVINKDFIEDVCRVLKTNKYTKVNVLSCLTGVDYRSIENRFELVYHLYSTFSNKIVVLKVTENINDAFDISFPTISNLWKAADWYEREIFDLFGVKFLNHPNLKRILLPEDWQGYPLRKDYKSANSWHGMPIEYDRTEDIS